MLRRYYSIKSLFALVVLAALGMVWWNAFTDPPKWFESHSVPFIAPTIPSTYRNDNEISLSVWAGEPTRKFRNGEHFYSDAYTEGWTTAISVALLHSDWCGLENECGNRNAEQSVTFDFEHYQNALQDGYANAWRELNVARKSYSVAEIQQHLEERTGRWDRFRFPTILTIGFAVLATILSVMWPKSKGG